MGDKQIEQEYPDNYSIEPWQSDDDIMRQTIGNIEATYRFSGNNYSAFGNNCQDFVDAIKKEYKNLGGEVKFRPIFFR